MPEETAGRKVNGECGKGDFGAPAVFPTPGWFHSSVKKKEREGEGGEVRRREEEGQGGEGRMRREGKGK